MGVQTRVFVGGTDLQTMLLPLAIPQSSFDVIQVMSPPYSVLVRRGLIVYVAEPVRTEWPYYSLKTKIVGSGALVLEMITLQKRAFFCAASETTRMKLIKFYGLDPKRIVVIPGGVDLNKFTPGEKSVDEPKILMCSRLDKRKNLHEALLAFSRIREAPFSITIVGEGPEGVALKKVAAALNLNVRFTGNLTDSEVAAHFGHADIFVSTSLSEGFGLSLIQAMAAGCASVVSDIGAHRELIRNGENGLIYESVDDLANKIDFLVGDSSTRARLGREARNSALGFSWGRAAREMLELYTRLSVRGGLG